MSVNLLELVKGVVGSQLGPLAGILGESEEKTQSVVAAAIPTLLGGLIQKSSSPTGASEIFKTLDDYDGGMLDNLDGLLGGGNHASLLNKGSGLLDMVLGNKQNSTLQALAKMVGLGDSKIVTILGLLAPIVMGVLGKQRRSQGLDAGGLAGILAGQREHLKGELPKELSDAIGLEDIRVDRAPRMPAPQPSTGGGGSLLKTLLPLVLLAGLGFLAMQFMSGNEAEPGIDDIEVPEITIGGVSVPELNLPGVDTGAINKTFGDLTDAIGGVKDEASARLVLPKIRDAGTMMDGLDLGALASGPQKDAVGGLFRGLVAKVRSALETAYAIPGVRGILEPIVGPFLERFSVFGI